MIAGGFDTTRTVFGWIKTYQPRYVAEARDCKLPSCGEKRSLPLLMISTALDKGMPIFLSVGSAENVLFFMLSIMFSGGQTVKSGISCVVIAYGLFLPVSA